MESKVRGKRRRFTRQPLQLQPRARLERVLTQVQVWIIAVHSVRGFARISY